MNLENDELKKQGAARYRPHYGDVLISKKQENDRLYGSLPTDDEDLLMDGSGWNR